MSRRKNTDNLSESETESDTGSESETDDDDDVEEAVQVLNEHNAHELATAQPGRPPKVIDEQTIDQIYQAHRQGVKQKMIAAFIGRPELSLFLISRALRTAIARWEQ